MQPLTWENVALLGLDIDGTLTDGFLYYAGTEAGWTQRYAVRDGEAILRLARQGFPIVPISRNKTQCAKLRMAHLKLPTTWVGVDDKEAALDEVCRAYQVTCGQVCYLGDGAEDAPLLRRVGLGCSLADAHPLAQAAAGYVCRARGGCHAAEEVVEAIMWARGWTA